MNMLRRGPPSLDAERESFEKTQMMSIQKAINTMECAAKEKHVRNAILGTYQEKGGQMFWHVVRRLPLSTQSIVAWKFCHVLHKVLRDGHPKVLKDSIKYKQQLKDLGRNWGQTQGYGRLIGCYLKCLTSRMDFHSKYPSFPGSLSLSDEELENIGKLDINTFFELSVDILDCIDVLMDLQQTIFSTLDMSKAVSMTGPGQCRLAPCILVILDSSQLYDYTVKLLFKLHACLPADTLSGHRHRFKECHARLKKFYYICSNLQYFKRLIQVPLMPDKMPDFLIQSDGSHELGPIRVLPEEENHVDRSPSPEPEVAVAPLIDTNFDELFGESDATFSFNGTSTPQPDPRDVEIHMLKLEIERLKAEIELMQSEHSSEVRSLLDRIKILQQELEESRLMSKDASDELSKIRKQAEVAEQQAESAVKAQSLLHDIEKRAAGNEEMYKKLKEKHLALVKDHAALLRKNADTRKQADTLQQSAGEIESDRSRLLADVDRLTSMVEGQKMSLSEEERRRKEERERILAMAAEEAGHMIKIAIESLDSDMSGSRTCSASSLMRIVERTNQSLDRLDKDSKSFEESQEIDGIVQSVSGFGHWMAQTIESGGATCNMAPESQGEVSSPTKWRNHLFDTVMALQKACRSCGEETLTFLDDLKTPSKTSDSKITREKLDMIMSTAKELLPKMSDVRGGDLHDLVEQEMASTTQAVEQAAERIEALLNEARQRDTGVNLEVNERILDSCTELMKFIQILISSSKDLQREIVEQGRGASSTTEFYMKNSRWTEGLISAAKAVGWGATMLTDAADLVIQGDGKFEELMVCSHEISASTAQLVAASRVKAGKNSTKLKTLQSASRNVNGATAKVVASTNAGRRQLDEVSESLEGLASVTLTQIKRKEMDSQVKVLELEQALQQERVKLGTLRKKHYELAGAKDEEEEEETPIPPVENSNNNNNVPTKPPLAQKPVIPPKPVET
uniref:huntingtin-interacting protein 1 isoform X2 n=1 Tax=Ciona intestinalis TaxID=7719 RepID=UPI00089DCED1|nr:huntingtin-interacting protein 1 isoform X2 [Ciona intestinalis]|eukprot:XP_018670719.1 huntingtin-interacting protein 1 isoform X2 [Ciona intestinalis]